MYAAASPYSCAPAYSLKQIVRAERSIFSSKRSFLLRKRIIEVSPNHLLLQIESNSFKLSCIRFVVSSSWRTWSYSDIATQKMMAVYILKTMNPLLSLRPLATNIKQFEIQVFKREMNLDDAGCLDSCSQNILLRWLIILCSKSVQIVKEIFR